MTNESIYLALRKMRYSCWCQDCPISSLIHQCPWIVKRHSLCCTCQSRKRILARLKREDDPANAKRFAFEQHFQAGANYIFEEVRNCFQSL